MTTDAAEIMDGMFGPITDIATVAPLLKERHYLGPSRRGWAWSDEYGVMVFANPSSRHLPHDRWLELVRWCITGGPNAGSQQWAKVLRYLKASRPDITTVVSYSDPSVGHTGALYKACNWIWAPTWLRLRPPPTANGNWGGTNAESVKDRWIYPLRRDDERPSILAVKDDSIMRRDPNAGYQEPFWRRGRWTPA